MDVKEAIRAAKAYVRDVYSDEDVTNLGLEETEYHETENSWSITVGFSRPWNTPRSRAQEVLENLGAYTPLKRSYKVVEIDSEGRAISMKNRELVRSE